MNVEVRFYLTLGRHREQRDRFLLFALYHLIYLSDTSSPRQRGERAAESFQDQVLKGKYVLV